MMDNSLFKLASNSPYVDENGEPPEDTWGYGRNLAYRGTSMSELKRVFEGGELGAYWGYDFNYSSDFADGYAGGGGGAVMVADQKWDSKGRNLLPDPKDIVAILEPHTKRILWERSSGFKDKAFQLAVQSTKTASAIPFLPFEHFVQKLGGIQKLLSRFTGGGGWFDTLSDEEVKREIEQQYARVGETLARLHQPLKIYREMDLASPEELNVDAAGVYWSYDEAAAEAHWGQAGKKAYVLMGQVPVNEVDWDETYLQNMDPDYKDEKEIQVMEPDEEYSAWNPETGVYDEFAWITKKRVPPSAIVEVFMSEGADMFYDRETTALEQKFGSHKVTPLEENEYQKQEPGEGTNSYSVIPEEQERIYEDAPIKDAIKEATMGPIGWEPSYEAFRKSDQETPDVLNKDGEFVNGEKDKEATLGPHADATVQIPVVSSQVSAAAQQIPDAELGPDGRENDLHITVKFGVEEDADALREVVQGMSPFSVTLGKLHVFTSRDDKSQAPVVAEVRSSQLLELHKLVDSAIGSRADDFLYRPHVTLAYVKAELAEKYEGLDWVEGTSFSVNAVVLSRANGSRELIEFAKAKAMHASIVFPAKLKKKYRWQPAGALGDFYRGSFFLLPDGSTVGTGAVHAELAEDVLDEDSNSYSEPEELIQRFCEEYGAIRIAALSSLQFFDEPTPQQWQQIARMAKLTNGTIYFDAINDGGAANSMGELMRRVNKVFSKTASTYQNASLGVAHAVRLQPDTEKWIYHPSYGAFTSKVVREPHTKLIEKKMGRPMSFGKNYDSVDKGYAFIDPDERTVTLQTFYPSGMIRSDSLRVGVIDSTVYNLYKKRFPGYSIIEPALPVEDSMSAYASAKTAMKINVPEFAKDHFWVEPPVGSVEFWAFRFKPKAQVGDTITFLMDKKPVAEAVIANIEAPGQSQCERTGEYKNRWKVYWTPESFKKLSA